MVRPQSVGGSEGGIALTPPIGCVLPLPPADHIGHDECEDGGVARHVLHHTQHTPGVQQAVGEDDVAGLGRRLQSGGEEGKERRGRRGGLRWGGGEREEDNR